MCAGENRELANILLVLAKVYHRMIIPKIEEILNYVVVLFAARSISYTLWYFLAPTSFIFPIIGSDFLHLFTYGGSC